MNTKLTSGKQIKTILVPYDFSNKASSALHYAAEMARYLNAEVHILHVFDPPTVSYAEPIVWVEHDLQEQKAALEKQLDMVSMQVRTKHLVNCSYECVTGLVSDQILYQAAATRFGLVVIGEQDIGVIKKAFSNTTTANVVKRAG